MEILLKIVHLLISLILIFVVLLQNGKGAEMGASFGGSSSKALFGASGANTFMTKLTTFAAVLFVITCLSLAYMSSHMATQSLMMDVKEEAAAPLDVNMPPAGMPDVQPPMSATPVEAPAALPATPAEESHEGHNHP